MNLQNCEELKLQAKNWNCKQLAHSVVDRPVPAADQPGPFTERQRKIAAIAGAMPNSSGP